MKIKRALFIGGFSSFYFDDQQAIKNGAHQNGFMYSGQTETPGFQEIRQAGETVSIVLELENGRIAVGDCAAVQYSGAGGRDPLFTCHRAIPFLEQHIRPILEGYEVCDFYKHAKFFDTLKINGKPLHTAIRYGLSQALLDATALATNQLKTEVICREFNLPLVAEPVRLLGQSGDDRYTGVDKMLLKRIDLLPHGLINNIPDKLGYQGEKLLDYVCWLTQRVHQMADFHPLTKTNYKPEIHLDVYGTIGTIFNQDASKIANYLAGLKEAAGDLDLLIEGPVDAGSKDAQIELLASVKQELQRIGSPVKIAADEWCNTVEDIAEFVDAQCCDTIQIKTPDLGSIHNVVDAVLYCRQHGVESYQGGTCNETDISARTCVHLALAARPSFMLVKPGMGFDEGMTIVNNEMLRSIALLKTRLKPRAC